jgi:hypothetical protein
MTLGRAWNLFGSRKKLEATLREMLAVGAARRESAVPSVQPHRSDPQRVRSARFVRRLLILTDLFFLQERNDFSIAFALCKI